MRRMTIFLLTVLCAVAGHAAEPVFDIRFDTRPDSTLPAPWKNYGSGTPMQIHGGNLVFTNTDPQCESGIVCRLELEKGFDYEFTVELAEAVPGKKVEGVFLQLSSAGDRNIRVLTKAPAGSGDLGQYVSSSMHYLAVSSSKAAFYLRSQKGSTPRAKIRRVRAVRSADLRRWLPANQPPFHVYGLPFMKENNGAYYRYPEARASGLSTWNASCAPSGARILAQIDAAIYVMGPLLGDAPRMKERYPKMVATLRRRRPEVPILLVTRLHTLGAAEPHEVNSLVRELYEKRRAAGDKNIHFLDVFPLYSDGTIPYTIDGTHVTDLGAKVIADAFVPVIRRILGLP